MKCPTCGHEHSSDIFAPAPGEAEPAAWRWKDTSDNWLYTVSEPTLLTAGRLNEVQPLYAAPPSAVLPDAVREALVNSQSLLAMIYQIRADADWWKQEGVVDLLEGQIKENRAALSRPQLEAAPPEPKMEKREFNLTIASADIRAAFERLEYDLRSQRGYNDSQLPPFELNWDGSMYATQWVRERFNDFSAGYREAAWLAYNAGPLTRNDGSAAP